MNRLAALFSVVVMAFLMTACAAGVVPPAAPELQPAVPAAPVEVPSPTPPAPMSTPTPVPTVEAVDEPEPDPTATPTPQAIQISLARGAMQQLVNPDRSTTLLSPDGYVRVFVEPGSVTAPTVLVYTPVDAASLPSLPEGVIAGATLFDLDAFSPVGDDVPGLVFGSPISLTIELTAEDLRLAVDDPSRLTVQHYKEAAGRWIPLETTVDLYESTITAKVDSLSIFAVFIEAQGPVPTPEDALALAGPNALMPSVPEPPATATPSPIPVPPTPTPTPVPPTPTPTSVPPTETPTPVPPSPTPTPVSNDPPELYLLDADKRPRPGRTMEIRIGASDADANASAINRLDAGGEVVDTSGCSGEWCSHTFQVEAPDAYDTSFTEQFVAVDVLGRTSEVLVVTRRTRGAPGGDSNSSSTPATSFPYSVVDSNGNTVTFEEPPERIVAYDAAAVEALFEIGEGQRVVGTHSFVFFPPEVANIPKVGDAFNADIEAIVALQPDLVFIFFPTFVEQLENAGLKVLYVQSLNDDFIRTVNTFEMWGRITGATSEAEALGLDFIYRSRAVGDTLEDQPDGPRVLWDTFQLFAPGPDTLVGNVLDLLDLQSISDDISGYQQLSAEVVVARDPEIIYTFDPSFFTGNPAYSDVSAVKNGQILAPNNLLNIAGPRFVVGIEQLAEQIYPDLF